MAIFCRLLIPKHVDSFLRPAHVSFGIPNNMFFYSLSILSCSLWRSVDCLLKNLWDIFAELILYAWENHAKRRKRGKSNLIFHFSPFSVAFEPNKDSTLSVVERGLISVAFSLSCSFVSVRRLIYSWLNFFFWPSSSTYPTQSSTVQYWKNEHCQDDFWNEGPFLSE